MKLRYRLGALLGAGLLTVAVAGVALAATHDTFNGWPNQSCSTDEGSLPTTMLWIWTGDAPSSLTINGEVQSGSWAQQGQGVWHFTVDVSGTNYPPTSASVEYTGADGILTLSGCDEGTPSESQPAESQPASEAPSTSPVGSLLGDTDQPTLPPTDSLAGNAGPSDGAWLLVVGLGVLLASIVVLTPARAKSRR